MMYIKNDDVWCKVNDEQPANIDVELDVRKVPKQHRHPLRSYKLTRCGDFLVGVPQAMPIDSCPTCDDCDS